MHICKMIHVSAFVSLHVVVSVGVSKRVSELVCVFVCQEQAALQPTESGTVARQGDHFQPAGDLTLICSMLIPATGLRPQRAGIPASTDTFLKYIWL